jgi:hypothetical protein
MRAKGNYEVPVTGAVPIKRILDKVRAEFEDLVPAFEYYAQPAALRAQIAAALSAIDARIQEVEGNATRRASKNELVVAIGKARELVRSRIQEGNGILEYPGQTLKDLNSDLLPWIDRTCRTLQKLFASEWNSEEFAGRVGFPTLHTAGSSSLDAIVGHLAAGLDYLRDLDEDLDLIETNAVRGASRKATVTGENIFIGHGGSAVWRQVKDFLQDRLHLPWDEFNREPAAGISTVERLETMLDRAAFALLVMTGEDEQPTGELRARENVVHEAGLFQGRLGFRKAIILLEEGCQPFSNIDGLTVLRFPKGHISAKFEEIRETLEREGILPKAP